MALNGQQLPFHHCRHLAHSMDMKDKPIDEALRTFQKLSLMPVSKVIVCTCMCIYVCTRVYTWCVYVYSVCARVYMYVYMCVYTCEFMVCDMCTVSVHVCGVYLYVYMCVYVCVLTWVSTCTCKCVSLYHLYSTVHMRVYMCVHVCGALCCAFGHCAELVLCVFVL